MAGVPSNPSANVAESTTAREARPDGSGAPRIAREIRHDLGNALGALRLRVQLVLGDPTCRAAQAKNLEAIERILNRSMDLFAELSTRSHDDSAAPKSKKKKRKASRKKR